MAEFLAQLAIFRLRKRHPHLDLSQSRIQILNVSLGLVHMVRKNMVWPWVYQAAFKQLLGQQIASQRPAGDHWGNGRKSGVVGQGKKPRCQKSIEVSTNRKSIHKAHSIFSSLHWAQENPLNPFNQSCRDRSNQYSPDPAKNAKWQGPNLLVMMNTTSRVCFSPFCTGFVSTWDGCTSTSLHELRIFHYFLDMRAWKKLHMF